MAAAATSRSSLLPPFAGNVDMACDRSPLSKHPCAVCQTAPASLVGEPVSFLRHLLRVLGDQPMKAGPKMARCLWDAQVLDGQTQHAGGIWFMLQVLHKGRLHMWQAPFTGVLPQ